MYKTAQPQAASVAIGLDAIPPLPPRAYRLRIRGALQRYRHEQKRGWTKIIKIDLYPLLDKGVPDRVDILSFDTLKQRLTYWCDYDGDANDPIVVYVIEQMLNIVAPEIMARFNNKERMLRIGAAYADHLSIAPDARSPFVQPGHPHHSPLLSQGIPPGVYALLDHSILPIKKRPQNFIVFTDIGSNDIMFCQIITVSWMAANSTELSIMRSFGGFVLPFAVLPLAVLRAHHAHTNDMFAIFVLAESERPDVIKNEPSYVFSLASPGMSFDKLSRMREHVWRPARFDVEYAAISEIASHRLWEV